MIQQKQFKNRCCAAFAFIAMALSFMSQITPLWAQQSDGTPIVICSTFGTKTIFIDEGGNETPETPEYKVSHCTMCLNASMASLSNFANMHSAVLIPLTAKLHYKYIEYTPLKSPAIKSINGIRAPPVLI